MVAGLEGSYGYHRYTAGRSVAMKAAAVRENVRPSERASVVGSPSMGLAG